MNSYEHESGTIAYERRGTGPTVVFLHNGGTSSVIWREQVASLQDHFDVIAVDLPGFGCSPRPAAGIDRDGHVELVGALIDDLDVAPVAVVGNCMGSNIAAALATARPDAVCALVLVNPLTEATFSAGAIGALHGMQRWLPGPTRMFRTIARKAVPPRVAGKATIRMQIGRKGAALGLQHDPALLACTTRSEQLPALIDVLDDMSSYRALDHDAALPRELPVCTIWGAQNRVLSPRAGRELDGRLCPERREVLDGCGHLPMLEDPAAVTSIIEQFVSAHHSNIDPSFCSPVELDSAGANR